MGDEAGRPAVNWRAPGVVGATPTGGTSTGSVEDVGVGSGRHVPALDGVRGLAVLAVLLFHGGMLDGGYLGVDAFFVLSGFLITGLLVSEVRRSGRVDLREFWVRRARRLLPALFLVLLGVALFAWLFASASELDRIRSDALATLGYVANWHSIAQDHGYWQLFQTPSPLEHTWSLAIEEQFYLLWPLVVFGIAWVAARAARGRRPGRGAPHGSTARGVLVLALAVATASTIAMWFRYDDADTSRAYLGTDTRIGSILFGAALAAWLAWRGPLKRRGARVALEIAGVIAILWLAFAWATIDGESAFLYRGGFLLCGLAAAVVIAAAVHAQDGPVGRFLAIAPLCALGVISYGLYLWHWPVYLVLDQERTGLDGWGLLTVRIAVSLAFAIGSFILLERPVRRGYVPTRRLVLAVPVAAIACIAAILVTTSGGTTSAVASPLFDTATRHTRQVEGALAVAAARQPLGSDPRLLIVGDSVAGNLASTAVELHDEFGVAVGDGTSAGCVLGDGVTAARTTIHGQINEFPFSTCEEPWLGGLHVFPPSQVVIAYGSAAAFTDLQVGGEWLGPCSDGYQRMLRRDMSRFIDRFEAVGAQVWLTRIPPLSSEWAPADAAERIGCVNQVYADLATRHEDMRSLDLDGFICPAQQCRQDLAGERLRTDGMHYVGEPARYVTRWVLHQVVTAKDPRLLVVGDSIAETVATGLAQQASTLHIDVRDGSLGGCAVMGRIEQYRGSLRTGSNGVVPNVPACEPTWTAAAASFRPDTVILLNGSNASFTEVLLDGSWVDSCSSSYRTYLEDHLRQVLSSFTARGAKVVLATVPPIEAADFLPDNGNARIACVNDVYARLADRMQGVSTIDLAGFVCPDGVCRTEIAGEEYRPDGFHFSTPAANAVGAWLAERVTEPETRPRG